MSATEYRSTAKSFRSKCASSVASAALQSLDRTTRSVSDVLTAPTAPPCSPRPCSPSLPSRGLPSHLAHHLAPLFRAVLQLSLSSAFPLFFFPHHLCHLTLVFLLPNSHLSGPCLPTSLTGYPAPAIHGDTGTGPDPSIPVVGREGSGPVSQAISPSLAGVGWPALRCKTSNFRDRNSSAKSSAKSSSDSCTC